MRWSRAIAIALSAAALALAAAPAVRAQQGPGGACVLQFESTPTGRLLNVRQPSGAYNSFLGGGVTARCPVQGLTLVADSAEYYGDAKILRLIGSVRYIEPRVTVTSDQLTYWQLEERLRAEGNVVAVLPSGTTMRGPLADYYRAVPPIRSVARMEAPGRPTLSLAQADTSGRPTEPVGVVANNIVMVGDSLVYAGGRVEITRTDLIARGDSAFMDSGREYVRLMREPVIEGRTARPFVLSGNTIDLYSRERALERVIAADSARGTSQDATLSADTLDFRMSGGRMQRVFGFGRGRSRAVSPTYDVSADSLDVLMPEQRLREARGVGGAVAESLPDTARLRVTERDWLRGDTVIARFDTAATSDSSRQPDIRSLTARGSARSYYHLAPRDTTVPGAAINYVVGREITVSFADRTVESVVVSEQVAGVYADPTPPDSGEVLPGNAPAEGGPGTPPVPPVGPLTPPDSVPTGAVPDMPAGRAPIVPTGARALAPARQGEPL